jgi:hypothetical protein
LYVLLNLDWSFRHTEGNAKTNIFYGTFCGLFICQYQTKKKKESFDEYFEENLYVPKCAEAVDV